MKKLIGLILVIVLIGGGYLFVSNNKSNTESSDNGSSTSANKDKEESNTKEAESTFDPKVNQDLMDAFLEGKNVGFAYYNFDNKDSYTNNADTLYTAASTIKVGIAMVVCELVNDGTLSLDTKETYTQDDYEGGSGTLQNDPVGSEYTIEELMTHMITESDNVATQILIRTITCPHYQERMNVYVDGTFDMDENKITANQALNMVKYLYENPENEKGFDQIIDLMKHTIYNDRFSTYIDDDKIAHKIGDYGTIGIINDVGIVYGDDTFAYAFYSQDGSEIGNEYAAELGKYLYELNTKDDVYSTESKVETNEPINYDTLDATTDAE